MLQASLLGERTIADATGRVVARSPRTLALLGFLALHAGVPQPRGRIAAAFWPDSTEQQALTNLRRELHQLRRVLDDDPALVVTTTDLAWRDSSTCRVDLWAFRLAREQARTADDAGTALRHGRTALAAYGGDLLPGLFDDWVLAAREQLDRECTDLCELLVERARQTHDWQTALASARRRVELQPLEEAGYRSLIELQVELGDRAGAVSTYHHCASVLEQELGIQPHPATRAALDSVVPSPAFRRGAVAPAPGFVGRETEFALLGRAVRDALDGATRLVLVRGEPGVGKSRLLTEAARTGREAGAAVATAHCYAGTGRLALAPVAEWLQDPAIRPDVEASGSLWQAEVERLVPALRVRDGREAPGAPRDGPRGIGDAWQRHRFFDGLSRALSAGETPLLLVLDNLQWCDAETLDLLSFLCGELRSSREHGLVVLMAARAAELAGSPTHTEWTRRMRANGALLEIDLLPFRQEETARLADLLAGAPLSEAATGELQAATGGFPLYVVEAARAGGLAVLPERAGQPPAVGAVLLARLGQLGPEAREVAGLAAASGRDFDLPLLCEASDLAPEAVVQAVDELWRQRIVEERRTGYDFSHDLLRAATYSEVSPPRRWLLHRRLAQALELLNAGHTDVVAARLAEQYARAGNNQRAFGHYRRAADLASEVFASAEVIRHNQAALALLPQLLAGADKDELELDTLRSLAAAVNALRGYADPLLVATLQRLVTLAERLRRPDHLVDSLVGLWAANFVQGHNRLAHGLAQRAIDLIAAPAGTSGQIGQAHFAFGGTSLQLGRPAQAVEHFELVCEQAGDEESLSIGSHPAIHARAWSAHAHWRLGDTARAAAAAESAVDRARRVDHPYSLAIALGYSAVTWQLLEDRDRLLRAANELASLSDRYGFAYYSDWGVVLAGWARGGAGGGAQVRRGLAGLRRIGAFARMPYWLTLLAEISDDEEATALLDAATVTARAQDDQWWGPQLAQRRRARGRTLGRTVTRTLGERLPS